MDFILSFKERRTRHALIILLAIQFIIFRACTAIPSQPPAVALMKETSDAHISALINISRVTWQPASRCIPAYPGGVIFVSKSVECPCYLGYLLTSFFRRPETVVDFLFFTEENYQSYKNSDYKAKPIFIGKYSGIGKRALDFSWESSNYTYESEHVQINTLGEFRVLVQGTSNDTQDCDSSLSVVFEKTEGTCSQLIQDRIVGGRDVTKQRIAKNMGFISTDGLNCSASLVGERWVLTAAHCRVSQNTIVRIGGDNINSGALYQVEESFPHPSYETSGGILGSYSDIALLKLSRKVGGAKPFKVNDNPEVDGGVARAVGYGRISYNWGGGIGKLRQVDVPIVPFSKCYQQHKNRILGPILNETLHICAGRDEGGCDSCHGDSGGPLLARRTGDDEFFLVGIVSMGETCAPPNRAAVYTRVSTHTNWIRNTTDGEVSTVSVIPVSPPSTKVESGSSASAGAFLIGAGIDGVFG